MCCKCSMYRQSSAADMSEGTWGFNRGFRWQVGDAVKREERQFERLHFALKKAQRDAAYLGTLEQMLAKRKAAEDGQGRS